MVFILILSLFGYCALLVTLKYCTSSQSPLFTICFIAILELLGGMFNLLLPMTYVILAGGLLSIIIVLFYQLKGKQFKAFIKELLTPGFVLYFVSILIFYKLCIPLIVNSTDEFSHWALYPKYLMQNNSLPINDKIVPFFFLPPIGSLVQYYFARFFQNTEAMLYWGQSIFLLAALVSTTSKIKWTNAWKAILIYALSFLVLLKYNDLPYFNLYSDALTAIIALSVYAYYMNSDKSFKDLLKLAPILFIIPLIRTSAPAFAIFSLVLILVDQIYLKGFRVKTGSLKSTIKANKHIVVGMILLITILASTFIWNTYIDITSQTEIIDRSFRTNTRNLQDSILYASEYFGMLSYLLIGDYSGAYRLFSSTTSVYLILLIITMIVLFGLHYKGKVKEVKRIKVFFFSLSGIIILYTIGLLFTYLYRFSIEEADSFAAYSRYFSAIVIFILLAAITYIFSLEKRISGANIKRGLTYILVFLLMLILASTSTRRLDIRRSRNIHLVGIRYDVYNNVKDYIGRFNQSDKVYIIYQGQESGLVPLTSRYELMVDMNESYFNLNQESNFTVDDLSKRLAEEGYNYLLVENSDDYLWSTYSSLFDETNHKLYKVNKDATYLLTHID